MKKSLLIQMMALLVIVSCQTREEAIWKPLFNGRDFTGWEQRGGTADFIIQDNVLIGVTKDDTPSSFLCTQQTYENFELELEVRMDTAMNSGIQFRSFSRPDYQNGKVHGYQAELDPSERAWTGGIFNQSRGGWAQTMENNPEARAVFMPMEWNKLKILADDKVIKTWVNGVQAADFTDTLQERKGMICIQVHSTIPGRWPAGKRVEVKNIRIKEL